MERSNGLISADTLYDEIRSIYNSDSVRANTLIETYLEQRLKEYSLADKLSAIENLTNKFKAPGPVTERKDFGIGQEGISQVLSLLLGKDIPMDNLSSGELMEKLSHSLNTVFDSLNQITGVIHTTLLGESVELQTIRHIIGSDLESTEARDSLQNYLDQIREAFLVAHRAFQQAAADKTSQILNELDPDRISESTEKSLKFGPLRKAGNYDVYTEKYQACRKWYDSGRFTEELLREFEKICQKLYKKKARSY
jgi:hypothetical protein